MPEIVAFNKASKVEMLHEPGEMVQVVPEAVIVLLPEEILYWTFEIHTFTNFMEQNNRH